MLTNPLFISDVIRFVLSLRSFHDQELPVSDDFSSYYDMGDNSPLPPYDVLGCTGGIVNIGD